LSPDGKHLAYTAGNCASWQNVWLTVVDGRAHATDFRGRLRLPSDAVIWAHPLAFEPRSGAFLVDVSSYNGECRGPYHRAEELFLVAAAGGAVTRVADISSYMFFSLECCAAALSPDGRMLAYYAQDNYGYWIRIVPLRPATQERSSSGCLARTSAHSILSGHQTRVGSSTPNPATFAYTT
jgi:Tol biopolymer transport system component